MTRCSLFAVAQAAVATGFLGGLPGAFPDLDIDFNLEPFIIAARSPQTPRSACNAKGGENGLGAIALSLVALADASPEKAPASLPCVQRPAAALDEAAEHKRSVRKTKRRKDQLYVVAGIEDHRNVTSRTTGEYLIKWEKGQPSWEP